jgi:hypothetical protein
VQAVARGETIALALRGALQTAPLQLPIEITQSRIAVNWPLMCHSGSIGLLSRRLRATSGASLWAESDPILACYRDQVVRAARIELKAAATITALRKVGIETTLIKGWSVARRYPEPGLRPYADVDLIVAPRDVVKAREVIDTLHLDYPIDLHAAFPHADDRDEGEMLRRRTTETLRGVPVQILGDEDLLRLLCLHLMGHGAWRTIWLCDIVVLFESRAATFDWDYFLSGSRRQTETLLITLRLAADLLDMTIAGTPVERVTTPAWLRTAVLRQWGQRYEPHPPLAHFPRTLRELARTVATRWQDPIAATYWTGMPYNNAPRLPIQLYDFALRTGKFLRNVVNT